ncbi:MULTISPECIES: 3-oxoacyl-ACP reductase FabG [Idiomarina]|jgi:3-oxoacyl-[acyl-carrier protein] reductase|uniref:3-oxoacyl-[acyl-carrier-protein] reductase n=2 Tax=Idiomarina baltica TaxID=190892 RepID=A0A348WPK1_9GAMM|nr:MULTISPECIES: 3-oxoacyl-ACP reductase FabG [Idiomarina]MBL73945.1 3-oxoacyl-ACP reductase FabG [Idiomarinaceae bacterium]EAQ30761.1 3-oxoacyl-(acyl carrier protein) reductase, putative [Idiomarina baltica OS145]KXS34752.1 MAG: 3-oxoacyl-[acyl-carrier protein] reductase [Idiomarina sp. T82-3]MBR38259.1 3-oxoacyl-ACP reductase FabG [Idiomarina sp.]HAE90616.1 3-oxoacyl-ACP reductase FabG [Idiomarina sp.]|tara:strand:+ start:3057 stop:3794 length:738 start_codon:yes stop_codon:yes gene_type:complete
MFSLNEHVALVTGASRGIGRKIAEQLAAQGAFVIGTATSDKGAASIAEYLGDKGQGLALNVNETDELADKIKDLEKTHGKIDILVNNAGITRDNLMMRMKEDEWNAVLDTNLTAVFRICKLVIRGMMKRRHGRIINISSVVGTTGNPGQVNYCAAKAGLVGFSKSLAKEVAARGITVNCVAPGFIDTDMTKSLTDDQKQAIYANIPAERLGQPEEVASAVVFLASKGAAYITGETIHVNGGMAMV